MTADAKTETVMVIKRIHLNFTTVTVTVILGKSILKSNKTAGNHFDSNGMFMCAFAEDGKSAINLEISPNLALGHLFMLGRLAVPKIIYVRPVGSPENTSNIGEILT